jgi:hypothetical protein
MSRCPPCPVPANLDCPAITLPHPRFCILIDRTHPDYDPAYIPLLIAMANAGPPDPAPSPAPPIDAVARRAGKPRLTIDDLARLKARR